MRSSKQDDTENKHHGEHWARRQVEILRVSILVILWVRYLTLPYVRNRTHEMLYTHMATMNLRELRVCFMPNATSQHSTAQYSAAQIPRNDCFGMR